MFQRCLGPEHDLKLLPCVLVSRRAKARPLEVPRKDPTPLGALVLILRDSHSHRDQG